MAEFCVAAPVLVLLLWSIIYLSDMFIVKHETMVAARYGSWLQSRYDLNIEQVRESISNYFFRGETDHVSLQAPQVDSGQNEGGFIERTRLRLMPGRWTDSIIDELADNLFGPNALNIYCLNVVYDFPRLFRAIDLREDGEEYFNIQSEHFVLGNSWDGQRVEIHHLDNVLNEAISDVLVEMDDIDEKIEEIRSNE
jgi:hypothetical protein